MITDQGPQVLEFNCRLGDPEAQVLLPLMETDLSEVIHWCLEGKIHKREISWSGASCVGVVATAQGYPLDYVKGFPIHIDYEVDQEALIFHGGTKVQRNRQGSFYVTDGGRVLTVSGCGPTLAQAREKVYENIPKIRFEGAHYRRDIGI
jgi:phosphoribosylamine--glycine ligase